MTALHGADKRIASSDGAVVVRYSRRGRGALRIALDGEWAPLPEGAAELLLSQNDVVLQRVAEWLAETPRATLTAARRARTRAVLEAQRAAAWDTLTRVEAALVALAAEEEEVR